MNLSILEADLEREGKMTSVDNPVNQLTNIQPKTLRCNSTNTQPNSSATWPPKGKPRHRQRQCIRDCVN